MNEERLQLKVGALMLGALAILGAFFYTLGDFSLGPGYTIYVDYRFSGNIQPGAPVKVSGIKVGKVQEVQFLGGKLDEATGRRVQVRLKLWVQDRVKDTIRGDAEFFINSTGVLGEQYVEIEAGSWDKPPLQPEAIVEGVDPPRTDLIVARLYDFLDSVTTLLREDKQDIKDLLKNGTSAVRELNGILVENRATIGRVLASTDRFASESALLIADVRTGMGDPRIIGRTLAHADQALVHADQAVVLLTPKAARLVDEGTRVAGLVTEERIDRVLGALDGVNRVLDQGLETLVAATRLLTGLNEGKGTAGRLLTREDLYLDVKELVVELRKNPWKLIWKE